GTVQGFDGPTGAAGSYTAMVPTPVSAVTRRPSEVTAMVSPARLFLPLSELGKEMTEGSKFGDARSTTARPLLLNAYAFVPFTTTFANRISAPGPSPMSVLKLTSFNNWKSGTLTMRITSLGPNGRDGRTSLRPSSDKAALPPVSPKRATSVPRLKSRTEV